MRESFVTTGHKIAAITGSLLLLAGCSADPDALLGRARQEYAAHAFKAAQLDLTTVLKARPGDAAALELHARAALAMGDGEGAKASLDALPAGRRPDDFAMLQGEAALLRQNAAAAFAAIGGATGSEAERIRAQAALLKGDDAEAAAAFAKGEAAPGASARLLADYARFRLHHGDIAGAQSLSARALKADRASLDARLIEAQLAGASGDLRRALELYHAVAKDWPMSLAALTGKASILGDMGRIKEMEEVLAAASQAGVGEANLAWLQARARAARSDWKGAREILQANEAALVGQTGAQLLHAQVLVKLGQPEQARARLQRLLTSAPGDISVRRALAEAALATHDPRGALEVLRPLAGNPAASTADLRLLAEAAKLAGDPQAGALAQQARFPAPKELVRTLADADAAMKARNWGNAIAAYEKIMAVTDGKSALVLNNLAFAQDQVGNRAVALDYALRALKVAPENPSVMDTAGWLMIRSGKDRPRALALLRDAARRAPANGVIKAHLAAAEQG